MSNSGLTLALPPAVRDRVLELAELDWRDPWGGRLHERKSPNYWTGRAGHRVRCVVWHITDGSSTSALDWLTDPASDASANDLITEDGLIYNLVAGDDTPWTNGPVNAPRTDFPIVLQTVAAGINPNRVSYTIESAGKSSWGRGGSLGQEQRVALIGRTAQACTHYGLTADHDHILRHSYWDSVNRAGCPGFSRSEMIDWVEAVRWLAREWRGW